MTDTLTRPELAYRSRKILYAAIAEYIATGEPVGSRKLSRRHGLNLSPATIRNVLSDLEDAGYLAQPHASAGRVPTDAGFRLFVDALVQMREVTADDKAAILSRMRGLGAGRDDLLREAARLLSTLTGSVAVLTKPRPEEEHLSQLHFLQLREGVLLGVVVTTGGAIQNLVVPIGETFERAELERVNNYLEPLVPGRTLSALREDVAREMADERGHYDKMRGLARSLLEAAGQHSPPTTPEVVIEGQGRLFDRPEFSDVEKLRGYLRAFEDRERLLAILDRTLAAGGVHVIIGSEANLTDVSDISLISAKYGQGRGALAVVGPTRMDYAKVVPLVGFTAQCMREVLSAGEDDGPES